MNEHRARLREVGRRLVAAVAEVALARATAMQLGAHVDGLAATVAAAWAAAGGGGAPTPEAERAWQRQLRTAASAVDARERVRGAGSAGCRLQDAHAACCHAAILTLPSCLQAALGLLVRGGMNAAEVGSGSCAWPARAPLHG